MNRPQLTIASGNSKKVAEIEAMLGPLPLEIRRQPSSLKVEETGSTYLENALLKAKSAAMTTNSWAIADDSGMEVDALNGSPGIFSARFAKTNDQKIKKLLDLLGETPYRSARFHSLMVLCDPKGNSIKHAEGICWGEVLKKPAYQGGEFESIFWIRETKCVYGQLSHEQLTKLGSRAKAARVLAPYLIKELGIKPLKAN